MGLLADVIKPDVWVPYMMERSLKTSRFFNSGIVETNEVLAEKARGEGSTVNVPFFKDLTGNSELYDDTSDPTENTIASGQDIGVKNGRRKSWKSSDLAAELTSGDPAAAIADRVTKWWDTEYESILIKMLNGQIDTALDNGVNVQEIFTEDGNNAALANYLAQNTFIDGFGAFGEHSDDLVAIAIHSDVYFNLQKQNLITFRQLSEQQIQAQMNPIPEFLGKQLIVSDSLPKRAGTTSGQVYTSFIFSRGSIGYGEGAPKNGGAEMERKEGRGIDVLHTRRIFLLHTFGVKWSGTAAATFPSDAELQTGGNWGQEYQAKNIGVVAIVHNIKPGI